MNGQLTLDDYAARDAVMHQVASNSGEEWQTYAKQFLYDYCLRHEFVFRDDIWAAGLQDPPNDRRAVGPVWAHAKSERWVVETTERRGSKNSHATKKNVYRSLIYREGNR